MINQKRTEKIAERAPVKRLLRGVTAVGFAAVLVICATGARAQVAGSQTIGVSQEEMKVVATGWSARKAILGKPVYNDNKEKIGTIDDLIISPDKSVSFAIIGVGGFLGMKKHDVAIPVNHLKLDNDRLVLPGATKEALKSLPEFQYAKTTRNDKNSKG